MENIQEIERQFVYQFFSDVWFGLRPLYVAAEAKDPRWGSSHFPPFTPVFLEEELKKELDKYLAVVSRVSASVFEYILSTARAHVRCQQELLAREETEEREAVDRVLLTIGPFTVLRKRSIVSSGRCDRYYTDLETTVRYAQLSVFLEDPRIVEDPRYLLLVQTLNNLICTAPMHDEMFTRPPKNHEGHYSLMRDGFGMRHLSTFQRLIECDALWVEHTLVNEYVFRSIAEALKVLSFENSHETLPLRIALLKRAALRGREGEILGIVYRLARSFNTDEQRAILQGMISEDPSSPVAHVAEMILTGFNHHLHVRH